MHSYIYKNVNNQDLTLKKIEQHNTGWFMDIEFIQKG